MSNLCSCHISEGCEWCAMTSKIERLEMVLQKINIHVDKAHGEVMRQREHLVFLHLYMIKEEIKYARK